MKSGYLTVMLYSIGIHLYYLGVLLASVYNSKAREWIKGRRDLFPYLKANIDPSESPIWIHCASLGEFEQGRPVIEAIKHRYPNRKILITFFSPSGYQIRNNYRYADWVTYLPLDTRTNAKRFISLVKPRVAIFVKYELWYHYIHELYNKQIPSYLISAIFSYNQLYSKLPGRWYRKVIPYFTHIFVQDESSKQLLHKCNLKKVRISGDTRFDRVELMARNAPYYPVIEEFKGGSDLLIAGSTWPKDEQMLIRYINSLRSGKLKFIIAPHEINESHINSIDRMVQKKIIRYSTLPSESIAQYEALIIDNIGMLSALYQYGTLAYIGGGFGRGIHNILEPAIFGLPILFGPNYHKFREAYQLINLGGAFSVSSDHEFRRILEYLFQEKHKLHETGNINRSFVKSRTGATDIILNHLAAIML